PLLQPPSLSVAPLRLTPSEGAVAAERQLELARGPGVICTGWPIAVAVKEPVVRVARPMHCLQPRTPLVHALLDPVYGGGAEHRGSTKTARSPRSDGSE